MRPTGLDPEIVQAVQFDYELSASTASELCASMIREYGNIADSTYACYEIAGVSPQANVCRTLERQVFEERFGNDATLMAAEYGPYESSSTFFIVVHQTLAVPVGVLRIIKPSHAGLKSLNDVAAPPLAISIDSVCEHYDTNPSECWDIGTLAVAPEFRGAATRYLASALLYRGLYATAVAHNVQYFVAIVDERARRALNLLGIPFEPILDSRPFSYLDSEVSEALIGFVPGMPEIMIKYLEGLTAATANCP